MEAVADPAFPRRGWVGGDATPGFEAKTYYLARFLPKHCMKMKEIGPGGGGHESLASP